MEFDDPVTESQPGDILHGKNNRNKRGIRTHFIIYLGTDQTDDQFTGAMLTSSHKYNNIKLEEGHFEQLDKNGKPWQVQYNNSYISSEKYHKKKDWRPFTKVGQLTREGLEFINNYIGNLNPKHFKHNL